MSASRFPKANKQLDELNQTVPVQYVKPIFGSGVTQAKQQPKLGEIKDSKFYELPMNKTYFGFH